MALDEHASITVNDVRDAVASLKSGKCHGLYSDHLAGIDLTYTYAC